MIRISACVIVKNEEKNIANWLAGIGEIADEKIVVDTGSTDRTVEIARQAGAEIYTYAWHDDFAAAKNYALDQATGQWIIFADADEYFEPETQRQIRQYLEEIQGNLRIAGLVTAYYNVDTDQHNKLMSRDYQMRIFRHEKKLRYEGAVHERVINRGAGNRIFKMSEFILYHTGYSSHIVQKKLERNLRIMLADIEKNGEAVRYYSPLMDCYYAKQDYEKAAEYARLAIANTGEVIGQLVRQYACLFDSLHFMGRPESELQAVLDEALVACPGYPEPLCQQGYLHYEHGRYDQAENFLLQAMQLDQQAQEHPEECMDSQMVSSRPYVHWMLGKIQEKKGNRARAAEYYTQSLTEDAYQETVLRDWYRLIQQQEPVRILELLGCFYDRQLDRDFLLQVLQGFPYNEVYLYLFQPDAQSYEAFMSAAQYPAAAHCAAKELAALQQAADSIIPRGTAEQQQIWQQLRPAGMGQEEQVR